MALSDSTFSDFGGAVSDLFGAAGSAEAAGAYTTAAKIAQSNADITARSTAISETQEQRTIFQTIGTENADVGAAGLQNTGSALDLMRSSVQQGALAKQLIANQGEITQQGYEAQAAAYQGQAMAAKTASAGQGIGGILGAAAGILSIL